MPQNKVSFANRLPRMDDDQSFFVCTAAASEKFLQDRPSGDQIQKSSAGQAVLDLPAPNGMLLCSKDCEERV